MVNSIEHAGSSFRCDRSRQYQIPIILTDYVSQCLKEKKLVANDPYLVDKSSSKENEELTSGKITATRNYDPF